MLVEHEDVATAAQGLTGEGERINTLDSGSRNRVTRNICEVDVPGQEAVELVSSIGLGNVMTAVTGVPGRD